MNQTSGIFVRDIVRCAFGKRQSFLIEYILQKIKSDSGKDGFIFISDLDLWHFTNYTIPRANDALRFPIEQKAMDIKESITPRGLFIRTTEKELFEIIIPLHINDKNKTTSLNGFSSKFHFTFSPGRTRNGRI